MGDVYRKCSLYIYSRGSSYSVQNMMWAFERLTVSFSSLCRIFNLNSADVNRKDLIASPVMLVLSTLSLWFAENDRATQEQVEDHILSNFFDKSVVFFSSRKDILTIASYAISRRNSQCFLYSPQFMWIECNESFSERLKYPKVQKLIYKSIIHCSKL